MGRQGCGGEGASTHRVRRGSLPIEGRGRGQGGGKVVGEEEEEHFNAMRVERRPPQVRVQDRAQEQELDAHSLCTSGT